MTADDIQRILSEEHPALSLQAVATQGGEADIRKSLEAIDQRARAQALLDGRPIEVDPSRPVGALGLPQAQNIYEFALLAMIRRDLEGAARLLLPLCASPSTVNLGVSALSEAARMGRAGLVRLMLPLSDPLEQAAEGRTPLHQAIVGMRHNFDGGHLACLEALVGFGAEKTMSEFGGSPLHALLDVARAYDGVDPTFQEPSAEADAQIERALELLVPGSDLRSISQGQTPLGKAVRSRRTKWLDALLAAGADPSQANEEGGTALMLAARIHANEMISRLVGVSDLAIADREGRDALDWALESGCQEGAEILCAAMAESDLREKFASRPDTPWAEMTPRAWARLEAADIFCAITPSSDSVAPASRAARSKPRSL